MNERTSGHTKYEMCVISQLYPNVFSSFEHSFSSMKAYTDLHEAINLLSIILHYESFNKLFTD